MRLLKKYGKYLLKLIFILKNAICNMNLSVLQELWILPVLCLYMTVMNQRQISGEMK